MNNQLPPPSALQVIADDLSGAAECAAAIAHATGAPTPLVLRGPVPSTIRWAADIDSRALPAPQAAARAVQALQQAAARGGHTLRFKKIDSTLRGHVAAELAAILAVPGMVQAALVCPALPAQGRTIEHGRLKVHGALQPVDLVRMLAEGGLACRLLPCTVSRAEITDALYAAASGSSRVLVLDATSDVHLRHAAQALLDASRDVRLLAVGSAGLAHALAGEEPASRTSAEMPSTDGPLVAMVGSFSPVALQQVEQLAAQPDVHLVRLDAATWSNEPFVVARHVLRAGEHAADGRHVLFTASGTVPSQSTRLLVQHIAEAAEAVVRRAAVLLLTGGDTARTVLDRLRVDQLQVLGELEPGICLSRAGAGLPAIVTKAGGFGDSAALTRVLRRFHPTPAELPSSRKKP